MSYLKKAKAVLVDAKREHLKRLISCVANAVAHEINLMASELDDGIQINESEKQGRIELVSNEAIDKWQKEEADATATKRPPLLP